MIIEKVNNETIRADIESRWISCAGNLPMLINDWVSPRRDLEVASGFDDNAPTVRRVYFIFRENEAEVAVAYLTESQAFALVPQVGSLIPPSIKLAKNFDEEEQERLDADYNNFSDQREKVLEGDWSDSFCSLMLSLSNATKLAVGNALGENGEVRFSYPDELFMDFEEEPELLAEEFLSVHALQATADGTREVHESFIAVRSGAIQ